MKIASVVARGNGAALIHSQLAAHIPKYQLATVSPWLTSLPAMAATHQKSLLSQAQLIHAIPDYGPWGLPAYCQKIVTFHNYYIDKAYQPFATRMQRIYYRCVMRKAVHASLARANWITVVSRTLADMVRADFPSSTPIIIRNGVDTARFCPTVQQQRARKKFRLLFVGNPTQRKGFDWLTQLAQSLPNNCELAYTSGLRDVREKPQNSALIPIPYTPHDQMPNLYQNADALLFPTLREGLSLATLEAMACGLPVITTQCSSMPELIDQGQGGYLLQPHDSRGFIEKIALLANTPNLCQDMGNWNRSKVLKEFELNRMLREYQEIFDHALSKG